MTLMFARVTGKRELVSHSAEKLHDATQMFMTVGYERKMKAKTCFMDHLGICFSC